MQEIASNSSFATSAHYFFVVRLLLHFSARISASAEHSDSNGDRDLMSP